MSSTGLTIYNLVFKTSQEFFVQFYSLEIKAFENIFVTFTLLYVVFVGYALIRGKFEERSKDVGLSIFLLLFINSIIFFNSVYIEWVYNPVISTMVSLMTFYITPESGGNGISYLFGKLDLAFIQIFNSIDVVMDKISGWEIGTIIKVVVISFALALLYGLIYVAFVAYLIIGIVALHVFLLIGIIPMFFASFKETRHIFIAWLKAIITYGLIPVFASILMALTLFFLNEAAINISQIDPSKGVFTESMAGAFLIGGITLFLFTKVSEWVNALTGGSASGVGGLIAGAGAAAGVGLMMMNKTGMTDATKWGRGAAANQLDKATGGKVSNAYRKLKGLAE